MLVHSLLAARAGPGDVRSGPIRFRLDVLQGDKHDFGCCLFYVIVFFAFVVLGLVSSVTS